MPHAHALSHYFISGFQINLTCTQRAHNRQCAPDGDIVSLHRCGFSTTLFIEVISKKWVREGRGNRIGWSC